MRNGEEDDPQTGAFPGTRIKSSHFPIYYTQPSTINPRTRWMRRLTTIPYHRPDPYLLQEHSKSPDLSDNNPCNHPLILSQKHKSPIVRSTVRKLDISLSERFRIDGVQVILLYSHLPVISRLTSLKVVYRKVVALHHLDLDWMG